MMSETKMQLRKSRPFPWVCIQCGKEEVFPHSTDYITTMTHDGHSYDIHIPDLDIPTCRKCGEQLITSKVDNRIVAKLRMSAGLLGPQDIEFKRCQLGLSREALAKKMGVSEESVERWDCGEWIQSCAMDNLLRSFLNERMPSLGSNPNHRDSVDDSTSSPSSTT